MRITKTTSILEQIGLDRVIHLELGMNLIYELYVKYTRLSVLIEGCVISLRSD